MTAPLRVTGPGTAIRLFNDWYDAAPPKQGKRHWQRHSSAMEVARAWCRDGAPAPPAEMLAALGSHPITRSFRATDVVVEHVTLLDDVDQRREHRNHDLVVVGSGDAGRVLVAVEAKAGESFGEVSAEYYAACRAKPRSQVPRRLALLVQALTGDRVDPESTKLTHPLGARGYQLLTASVGAVVEAERRGCAHAVLLVHEFESDPPTGKQRRGLPASRTDLDAFVALLSAGVRRTVNAGEVVGPFAVHPTPFVSGAVALLVGKCRTVVLWDD